MKLGTFRLILSFLIVLLVGGFIGYRFGTTQVEINWHSMTVTANSKEPPPNLQNIDFSAMWTVLSQLEENYYDKQALDPQKLVNGAISGMVQSIGDPYTLYLPAAQNTAFKQQLAGQFSGIGAELGLKDKNIVVISPLDGSPAAKAGLKTGDQIVKVDNQSVDGWSLDQTVNKIRGPKGSIVLLSVIHKGSSTPANLSITRDTITVKTVVGWVKKVPDIQGVNIAGHANDKIAYIRLSQFGDNSNTDWTTVVTKLYSQIQNDKSVKGMVFDLRNNPGGYLTDAQFIASEFLKDGVIVQEVAGNGQQQTLSVSHKGLLTDIPLVVLINKGSASAAEITAGALHDRGRAKLVGDNSFGKGIVQQAQDLGGGSGLHVTVAKWLTPNGTWVGNGKDGKGLTPDYKVSLDPKDPTHDTQLEKAVEVLINQ